MRDNKKAAAVVLAGGKGSRMGSDIPKQYITVCGYPLIYYSLKAFEDSFVDEIILVCGNGDQEFCESEIVQKYDFKKVSKIVCGGKERYHSVLNGLEAVTEADIVFIHDGARPFVDIDIISRSFDETVKYSATVVAVPTKDTVKIADDDNYAKETLKRDRVWLMQTPQTFVYDKILAAYRRLLDEENSLQNKGVAITDDAMVMEYFGDLRIKFVMGNYRNIKITTPEDILIAKVYLEE